MSKCRPPQTPYDIYPKSWKDPDLILEELRIAENNCDVILNAAETMVRGSLLFHDLRNPGGIIDPLQQLVRMLKR